MKDEVASSLTPPPRASPAKRDEHDIISERAIVKAVETEFDRTLPYWRCFMDLRLAEDAMRVRPTVMSRETTLVCRVPCKVFCGVDVVWATTRVTLRVPRRNSKVVKYRHDSPEVGLSRYWRDIPFREESFTIGTMHFVHQDAHRKNTAGGDKSFHIQSVVLYDDPAVLQCVAGTMVSFAFMVYSAIRIVDVRREKGKNYTPLRDESGATGNGDVEALRRAYLPSPTSKILILGMGGNSMALSLREVIGRDCELHVVEIEPSVVEVCLAARTLPANSREDGNLHVHVKEAGAYLHSASVPNDSFDMIFMDLFEPMSARMDKRESLVHLCERKLRPGGLLVVNDHQLPSVEGLAPFCDMVGAENVQAVNLHGWNESVVVCVRPGDARTDGLAAHCHKRVAEVVFDIYEEVRPGWLPDFSWLKSCTRVPPKTGCRIWKS